ncbi:hypothetical protein MSG28_000983 [Choristoneura fumiferana]|uniref:Uncharacterized protein n=1 Tax=Choristoneura fumiferana TaxID=7141 RepID=A0ACC0K362_CHOFU|nr:hypothetical protein MSG28_000983 [Choristoneura fumiferana]
MALRQETAPALSPPLLHHSEYHGEGGAPPLATEDFDDLDEFEDAAEEPLEYTMDLQTAFEECEVAMRKFFNNDLVGASNIMKPWCRTSLYHSLGMSIFEFIPAMLTFDHVQINRTLAALKVCIGICNQHRRNYSLVESIGTIIRKPNFSTYTDLEAHAELCYAEALLLQAMMTIMEGEDLTGLIKGTLKVKNCYNSYKDCAKILARKQWESERSRVHFHSGVRLGTATFNLYPDGVWFLLFKGRLELMRGMFNPAIVTYNVAIDSQDMWLQFRHVCYWEIMWVNGNASYYKQRIAGKSLPMEKFMIKRCSRYRAQGGRLVLPALELLYDIPPECLDQDQDIEICEEDCVETTDFRLYMRQNYNWVLEGYYILGEKIADHKTRELDHKVWSSEGKI